MGTFGLLFGSFSYLLHVSPGHHCLFLCTACDVQLHVAGIHPIRHLPVILFASSQSVPLPMADFDKGAYFEVGTNKEQAALDLVWSDGSLYCSHGGSLGQILAQSKCSSKSVAAPDIMA
jgi:hypothetical protein